MNYFAHGLPFLDDPYFLAGTAVPDWLNVVDRSVRVRSKHAAACVDAPDPRSASLAQGVVQHHHDDAWFHETPAFAELSLDLCRQLRAILPADDGFRPHFLGHILVEILLDAALIAEAPDRLEAYYAAMALVDGAVVQAAVNHMAPRQTDRLDRFVQLFSRERFLCDYADDGKLWFRLNQVMQRVGLPSLPELVIPLLSSARWQVAERKTELLIARTRAPIQQAATRVLEMRP